MVILMKWLGRETNGDDSCESNPLTGIVRAKMVLLKGVVDAEPEANPLKSPVQTVDSNKIKPSPSTTVSQSQENAMI